MALCKTCSQDCEVSGRVRSFTACLRGSRDVTPAFLPVSFISLFTVLPFLLPHFRTYFLLAIVNLMLTFAYLFAFEQHQQFSIFLSWYTLKFEAFPLPDGRTYVRQARTTTVNNQHPSHIPRSSRHRIIAKPGQLPR